MEEATKMDSAEMTPVIENIVPSVPSERPNFRLKKYVTQDLRLSVKSVISSQWANLQGRQTRRKVVESEQNAQLHKHHSAFLADIR